MKIRQWQRQTLVAVLTLASVMMVLPFFWLLSTAFKPLADAFNGQLIPAHPTLSNFSAILAPGSSAEVMRWLGNSLLAAISASVAVMILDSLAAFGLARLQFFGRQIIFYLLIGSLMVPFIAVLIPLYLEFAKFNLLDTYGALIFPYTANAFGVFLLYQFYLSIPKELEDAAVADGATRFQMWRRIFFPLSLPATATLGMLTFMGVYNDFLWPLVATSSNSMRTMTVGVALMAIGPYNTNYPLLMALTVFSMVPTLIAFIFAQRQLMQGIATTGITI